VLEGHTSVPRGLTVSEDGKWLLSGGRDAVALLWHYPSSRGKSNSVPKTIPLFEEVEAIGFLPNSAETPSLLFYAGGEKGVIKIWDALHGKAVRSFEDLDTSPVNIDQQKSLVDVRYVLI
jgi:U3 small nucleolar RNA-associated protein 13